ncbi:unnamed protein product [Closterium sp. NIES-53]
MSWEGDNNERVLVPVGSDACSKDALRWAVANKISHPDDLLVLLHIVTKAPGPDGYDVAQSGVSKTTIVQHVRTAIMPMLSQLKASIDAKVRLELRVGRNDSRDAGIMEEAKKLHATCLVLSTKGRGMFSMRGKLSGSTSAYCLKNRPPSLSVIVVSKDKVLLSKNGESTPLDRSPALSVTGSPLPGVSSSSIPSAGSSPGESRRNSESRSDAVQIAQDGEGGGKVSGSGSGSGSGSFGKGSFVRAGSSLSDRSVVSDGSSSKEVTEVLTVAADGGSGEQRGRGDGQEASGKGKGEERGVDRELQQLREQQQQRLLLHQHQQLQAATKLAALMEGVNVGGGAGGGGGGWGGNGFGGEGRGEGGGVGGGGAGGEHAGGDGIGAGSTWSDAHDSASVAHAVARSQQHGSSGGTGGSGGFSLASSTGTTFTMGSGSGASSRAGSGGEPTASPIGATGSGSGSGDGAVGARGREAGMVAAASAGAGVKETGGVGESGGAAGAAGALEVASGVYCRVYSYEEIQRATDNFCPQLVLGEGGCGTVFSGMLGGSKVAVKVIKTEDATRAAKEFQREPLFAPLTPLFCRCPCFSPQHPLSHRGCCPSHHCIVYEFMASGTLEERLLCANNSPPLPWFARLRIAAEIASALLALHSQPKPIIHLDLKPANVLLDKRLVVKLADVGVARQMPGRGGSDQGFNVTHAHTSMPIGTVAYVDPEYQRTGDFSPKSDVYALGIILFDLLTGRQPAWYEKIEDAVDEGDEEALGKLLDGKAGRWPVGLAMEVARIAVRCSEMKRKKRPDLGEVVMPVLMKAQKEAVILMERMMAGM